MRPKVILLVPAGRKKCLKILVPHLVAAKSQFDYCEFWMNATWDEEDEKYVKEVVRRYPDIFLIKDDRKWEVKGNFSSHYGRYYHTLAKDNTIYIKMDDDMVWMTPDAIDSLVAARIENPKPLIVIPNIINNTFCNVKHQELGIYSDAFILNRTCHCPTGHYSDDFVMEAHTKFLEAIKNNTTDQYKFEDCTTFGIRTPNHVFAFFGSDMIWGPDDDESVITQGLATEDRPILVIGYPIFSHLAYTPQITFVHRTNILTEYKKLCPKNSES